MGMARRCALRSPLYARKVGCTFSGDSRYAPNSAEDRCKMKTTYKLNGKTVSASAFRRHRTRLLARGGGYRPAYSDATPGKSMAMGVLSGDLPIVQKALKDHGIVGVEYVPDKNGARCVITNNSKKSGRRKWMKVYGELMGRGQLFDQESFD
jgi:hypothetical protein